MNDMTGGEANHPPLHGCCSLDGAVDSGGKSSCYAASARAMNSKPSPVVSSKNLTPSGNNDLHAAEQQAPAYKGKQISYMKWCATLWAAVLATRCNFSFFVSKSVKLQRTQSSTPGLFPIPIPEGGWFERMPHGLSQEKRNRIHLNRAVSIIVLALHEGGCAHDDGLRRRPNSLHYAVCKRIRALIRSEGQAHVADLAGSGRRFPQLFARLSELSDCLTQLGPSACPYDRFFKGTTVPVDNEAMEELHPYRDLCAERLKITGTGSWPPDAFLDDELYMAFREPDSIFIPDRVPECGQYPICRDLEEELCKLAKVWDARGLLHILQDDTLEARPFHWIRVFNNFKNQTCDRQIADRRGRNYSECKLVGPSSSLPQGTDLMDLFVDPKYETLVTSVTDRKDYYHQLAISLARANTNAVGPPVSLTGLLETKAFLEFQRSFKAKKHVREEAGDLLGEPKRCRQKVPDLSAKVFVCFKSMPQGDHCGVDVATQAHANLLKSYGLLPSSQIVRGNQPLRSDEQCQGLCIDDFFAVSRHPIGAPLDTSLFQKCVLKANEAYTDHGLLGSPEKDVSGLKEKAVGAVVNGAPEATSRRLVTLASPIEKRLSLSSLTLELCRLRATTDALHVCLMGGWVSACLFRRCVLSVFHDCFSLVNASAVNPDAPAVVPLSARVKDELVLASVLIPFMETDLSAPFSSKVYCSDASDTHGAICVADIEERLSKILWRTQKGKTAYSKILPSAKAWESKKFLEEDETWVNDEHSSVPRPLAFRFAFVEIFAGAARISAKIADFGWAICPPIDLSRSQEYDLQDIRVMEWLSHLIVNNLILGFAVEPPCTTFSVMRRPALRDRDCPFGYAPGSDPTLTGNVLMHRGFQCVCLGAKHGVAGLYETPHSSKAKWLPSFGAMRGLDGVSMTRTDSCRFGSPHRKSFALVSYLLNTSWFDKRCICQGPHLQIQGKYTKMSATYTWELAEAIAESFNESFAKLSKLRDVAFDSGLENQFVNEVACSLSWRTQKVWKFKKAETHINIKEMSAIYRLVLDLAKERRPMRVVNLSDSNVVKGAMQKGRSGSGSLGPLLRRIGSASTAMGIFLVVPFVPTRLNPSDDPTRDKEVRQMSSSLGLAGWSDESIYDLAEGKSLRRVTSKWARLIILLCGPAILELKDRSLWRHFGLNDLSFSPVHWSLDFDSTLGYPGEGPSFSIFVCCPISGSGPQWNSPWIFKPLFALLIFLGQRADRFLDLVLGVVFGIGMWICSSMELRPRSCRFLLVVYLVAVVRAMPIHPRTPGDHLRASNRMVQEPLPDGRPVTEGTGVLRRTLLSNFLHWVNEQGIDADNLFLNSYQRLEDINTLLGANGRACYTAGKTMNSYSETINAVASWKPHLRRSLQGAWDIAYGWARREPPTHHPAMPPQVLLAMLVVSLIWGWTRIAGCLALGWSGLLRPGEIFQAKRINLYLPSDGGWVDAFAMLEIQEPKTRFSAARHQASKVDIPDMVSVLELAFAKIGRQEKLWPHSAQAFRARFKQLLGALRLTSGMPHGYKQLEVSSLRPGGATWILHQCDSGDAVMRRGRWASYRMMSIYIQEVSSMSFLMHIPEAKKTWILSLMNLFPSALQRAFELTAAKIAPQIWFQTLPKGDRH